MSACPPLHVLEDAAVGKSSGDKAISSHLMHCPACCRALEDIRQDNSLLTEITAVRRRSRAHRDRTLTPPDVEDYEVLECIAQGGQGVVYRAIQKRTKRCVALKMLLGGHFATPRQRARFEREVELAAGLHHPSIVTVHDSGITPDGRPFLSMSFIEGRPLDQWARSCWADGKGVKTIRRLVGVLVKVCSALSHAHMRGVLHRDLKPGNILVDANDEPHIVDFGLAKLVDCEATFNSTKSGEFMGTIAYAAPEQVSSGDSHADARSDVYALGVLLYEVLTGRLPYPVTGAIAEVVRQITTAEPRAPSSIDPLIPTDLDTIALKAMTKDLNRRYQSAQDLGEDLRRFLANEPIFARSDSTWYMLKKAIHRHRLTITMASMSALLLLMSALAGATYLVLGARADSARVRAVSASERGEAISLVLRSASNPRIVNKDLKGYRFRDLNRLEEQINLGWLAGNREREAAASSLLAAIYCKGSVPWGAEDLIRQANIRRTLDVASNRSETAGGFHDLAEVLLGRHRLAEAAHYCEKALDIDIQECGEKSVEAARDIELMARIKFAQCDNPSSVKLATNAIEIQSPLLGVENEKLALSLDTRTAAFLALGDFERAETDCLQMLRVRLTVLQDEDPAITSGLRRLAAILDQRSEGAHADALAKAFALSNRRDVADQMRKLTTDLDELCQAFGENSNTSKSVLKRLLSVKKALLGPTHKGLLSTLAALLTEASGVDDYSEKLLVLDHVARIIVANYGPSSIPYANCLAQQATMLEGLQRYSEALGTQRKALDVWLSLPIEHRDELKIAVIERGIALWMMYDGQFDEAVRRFAHCDEVIRRLHGPKNILSPFVRAGRAWSLMRLGHMQGIEQEAREALAIANQLGIEMQNGQRAFVTFCAGSIIASTGHRDEGCELMLSAWEGDVLNDEIKERAFDDRYRCLVVKEMIEHCSSSENP